MKIGIVIQNDFPTDTEVRTRKLAKVLHENGHDVTIFARGSGNSKNNKRVDYADVERFSLLDSTPLSSVLTTPLPINPLWALWVVIKILKLDIDLIVGGEIRAGLPALTAARLTCTPSVLDLQENNPELAKLLERKSLVHHIKRSPRLHLAIEMACAHLANVVWVVVEERKEDLVKKGVSKTKIEVVRNVPYLREFKESSKIMQTETSPNFTWPEFTMVYVGHISSYRGLDTILDAVPHVLEEDEQVHLAIAGEGDYRESLEEKVRNLGIENKVTFVGWVQTEKVPAFIGSGDLGLIPHYVNGFTNTTAPNKLFDYMMVGLPVLTSNMRPVERVIEEVNCGMLYESNASPAEVAKKILKVKKSDVRSESQSGYNAVRQEYNWENESKIILQTIERLGDDESR